MILAERLCLLAFDQNTGRPYLALDAQRFRSALAGLVLADLLFAQRVHADGEQLLLAQALPIAHPVLADATHILARHRAALTPSQACALMRARAPAWQRRMHKGLVARDVLEMTTPFPFARRYRPRSKQAWNECVEMLRALTRSDSDDAPAWALAIALHASGILGEILEAPIARLLIARLPHGAAPTASGDVLTVLARLIAPY